ncbi:MAG: carbon monoxide dehydrogenase, partial [Ilumatobacteraceae bacterium]
NALIASGAAADTPAATAATAAPAAPATAAQTAPTPAAPATPAAPTVRKIEHTDDVAPLDLLDAAGGTIAKRLVPVLVVIAVAVAAFVIFR